MAPSSRERPYTKANREKIGRGLVTGCGRLGLLERPKIMATEGSIEERRLNRKKSEGGVVARGE